MIMKWYRLQQQSRLVEVYAKGVGRQCEPHSNSTKLIKHKKFWNRIHRGGDISLTLPQVSWLKIQFESSTMGKSIITTVANSIIF